MVFIWIAAGTAGVLVAAAAAATAARLLVMGALALYFVELLADAGSDETGADAEHPRERETRDLPLPSERRWATAPGAAVRGGL